MEQPDEPTPPDPLHPPAEQNEAVRLKRARQRHLRMDACRAHIAQTYPAVLASPAKPLKVGIHKDLIAAIGSGHPKPVVRAVLGRRVEAKEYIEAIAAGGPRVDLAGVECGVVAPEHQRHARFVLEHIPPGADSYGDDCKRKVRSALLKLFEAKGADLGMLAESVGMSEHACASELELARAQRAERHAARQALFQRFKASGMAAHDFAAASKISVGRLTKAIAFAAAQETSSP